MLLYFAMAFPADCGTRIVSILPQDVFVHSASTEKVCHFNGEANKIEDIVELAGAPAAAVGQRESVATQARCVGVCVIGNCEVRPIAVFGGSQTAAR
jgi:hypothetical protein